MVANGFALQHVKGEDVEVSISELHSAMQMLHYTGELSVMMSSVKQDFKNSLYEKKEDSNVTNNEYVLEEVNATARTAIIDSEQHYKNYIEAQIKLIKDYNLPYLIQERETQVFTFSQNMKGGGKSGNSAPFLKHVGLDAWSMRPADIFWVDALGGIGHIGILGYANQGRYDIIDADSSVGVVRHTKGVDSWANGGEWSRVEALRYRGAFDMFRVANYAYMQVGKGYNWWFWDKGNDTRTYCSQLVWKSFKSVGVDIDRDKGLTVWPNDIRKHTLVRQYNFSQI